MHYRDTVPTPWGILVLISDGNNLKSVQWNNTVSEREKAQKDFQDRSSACPILAEAIRQLKAYIAGRLASFSLPLEPAHTNHDCRFRTVMETIHYGETVTYKELGAEIGSGNQAAGLACKRNPFSIIIPCHRVIKTGGRCGDYGDYGGGYETKKALITFEHTHSPLLRADKD